MGDLCLPLAIPFVHNTKAQFFNLLSSTFQHPSDLPTTCDIQFAEQLDTSDSSKPTHTQSPFDSLPTELISHILERGCFDGRFRLNNLFLSSMLSISHRFRQICLHTPSLWSMIKVTPGNTMDQLASLIPTYLARSMDYPLTLELTFLNLDQQDFVMGQLVPHSMRWKSLSISTSGDDIFSFIQHIPVPHLEYLNIFYISVQRRVSLPSPFMADSIPKLSFLSLRNVDLDNLNFSLRNIKTLDIRGYGRWPGYSELTTMLESSQSLENLILHVKASTVLQEIELMHQDRSQILLPHLRSLVVHTSEWLTSRINILIRLFACPKLQSLVVLESKTSHTIMQYNAEADPLHNPLSCSRPSSPSRSLVVRSASIYLSCSSVPSSTLTTLELHKVPWPVYFLLKEAFKPLKQLRHLLILGLNPNQALPHILDDPHLAEVDSSIVLPSLTTLTIEFVPGDCGYTDRIVPFLRLFSLPNLVSLNLRHMTFLRWRNIVDFFADHNTPEYPALTSLTVNDMACIIPTTADPGYYRNLTHAFPFLQRLSLDHIHSNTFIQHLLPLSLPNGPPESTRVPLTVPWPNLRTLLVSGDANVSKPLLGRVITSRERLGVPFDKLCLDHHLTKNVEFWNWIVEKVDVELLTNEANWWFHSS